MNLDKAQGFVVSGEANMSANDNRNTRHLPPSDLSDHRSAASTSELDDFLAAYDQGLLTGKRDSFGESLADETLPEELEAANACIRLLEKAWPAEENVSNANVTDEESANSALHLQQAFAVRDGQIANQPPRGERGPQKFGRFLIVRLLGHGGGGMVYLAIDPPLGRRLALKVPRPEFVTAKDLRHRFLLEAKVASRFDHPNIVQFYEAGENGPFCYIASAYCSGPTLAQWMRHHKRSILARDAASLVATLADAVEHAHQRGILHRDLKPSNVLLELRDQMDRPSATGRVDTQDGKGLDQYIPKLTDFGLAKIVENKDGVTISRAVLGTPAYMAPEQAEGRHRDIGPATDVYASGIIFYQLLTGQTPFGETSDLQTLQQIATQPPKPPSKLRPGLSRDLESICLKCLEKDPGERYARAADLAADLQRYLAGQLVRARAAGFVRRAANWSRRQPTLAAVLALSVLGCAAVGLSILFHQHQLRQATVSSARLREEVHHNRQKLARHDYARLIQGAYHAWQNADVATAMELLDRCRPGPGDEDLRGFEWYYVRRLCSGNLGTLHGGPGAVNDLSFSPDGQRLASGGQDGTVALWDHLTKRLVHRFKAHSMDVNCVVFSPDGRKIATAGADGQLKMWDATDFRLLANCPGHEGPIDSLAISSDGQRIASGGADRTIRVWDLDSGRQDAVFLSHSGAVRAVAFSPDGKYLACGGSDSTLMIWNLQEPDAHLTIRHAPNPVLDLAFSPDGRTLATASGGPHLWDLSTGASPVQLPGHRNIVRSVAFASDGTLATTGFDMTVLTWNVEQRETIHEYHAHTRPACAVAFSPCGNVLASADKSGVIQLWDPNAPQDRQPMVLDPHVARIRMQFSRDGRELGMSWLLADKGSEAVRWNLESQKVSATLRNPLTATNIAYSPKGLAIALAYQHGPVVLWHGASPDHFTTVADQAGDVFFCAFSPSADLLAIGGYMPGSLRLFRVNGGEVVANPPGFRAVDFSPDGRMIAMEIEQPMFAIGLWDCQAQRVTKTLAGHKGEIYSLAFSGDGRLLASGSNDGTSKLWDLTENRERFTFREHTRGVHQVAFDPAGRGLATASGDGKVMIWDTESGLPLLTLHVASSNVESIAFSHDGRWLATGSNPFYGGSGRVDLWPAPREVD